VDESENNTMNMDTGSVHDGDVIEFTLRGERLTAEAMLVTDDDVALLDLFDGDRPVMARLSELDDVTIFRPDAADILAAA
jgi:hypothetical protein